MESDEVLQPWPPTWTLQTILQLTAGAQLHSIAGDVCDLAKAGRWKWWREQIGRRLMSPVAVFLPDADRR
jgi:hypothetical protein